MKASSLNLDKLNSKDPKVKYAFAKELLQIGKEAPERLYPHFDYWVQMLESDNKILRWTAIDILGYVSGIDHEDKISTILEDLITFLHCGNLPTCSHTIFALGMIAKNQAVYMDRIIKELLSVPGAKFDSEDCVGIATGKVLQTFKELLNELKNNSEVISFIKEAQKSKWNATRKKADALMKRIEK